MSTLWWAFGDEAVNLDRLDFMVRRDNIDVVDGSETNYDIVGYRMARPYVLFESQSLQARDDTWAEILSRLGA